MNLEMGKTLEAIKDGTKEVAETAQKKTSEFHEAYISDHIPDLGKYGDAAKFAAELVPGVAEYNALVDGDWTSFAIAAGLDVAAVGVGLFTAGAGYALVKEGSAAAKAGVKIAAKEVAETAAKEVAEKTAKEIAEKAAKEAAEKAAKEVAEKAAKEAAEKAAKETAEKAAKEVAEKAAKETAEKVTKEVAEKTAKETTEKAIKEASEEGLEKTALVVRNKRMGCEREEMFEKALRAVFKEEDIIKEALIRNADGVPIKDLVEGTARKLDFVVKQDNKIVKAFEVTSETASKVAQTAKELRILDFALEEGGAFIKDPLTKTLLEIPKDLVTQIVRL